jgi:hypothetical protein
MPVLSPQVRYEEVNGPSPVAVRGPSSTPSSRLLCSAAVTRSQGTMMKTIDVPLSSRSRIAADHKKLGITWDAATPRQITSQIIARRCRTHRWSTPEAERADLVALPGRSEQRHADAQDSGYADRNGPHGEGEQFKFRNQVYVASANGVSATRRSSTRRIVRIYIAPN